METAASLQRSREVIGTGEELAAEELRSAAYSLGHLLGRVESRMWLRSLVSLRKLGPDPIYECLQGATLAASTWEDEVMADVKDVNGTTGQRRHQPTGR